MWPAAQRARTLRPFLPIRYRREIESWESPQPIQIAAHSLDRQGHPACGRVGRYGHRLGTPVGRGIVNYSQHGPWNLWIKSGGQERCGCRRAGVVTESLHGVGTQAAARHVRAAGVPVVNISAIELPGVAFPRVATDLLAAGRMAAEH